MNVLPFFLSDLADFLREKFDAGRFPASERGGIYKPSNRPIRRIGLALEPWADLAAWLRSERLDALWLHRPWKLDLTLLPSDVGVLMHHLPFDEYLTTGYNERLAAGLGMESLEELGHKQAVEPDTLPKRPIGMIGNVAGHTHEVWLGQIQQAFGGYDRAEAGRVRIHERVAVVGAMNQALVHEAHDRGVTLYLTGEYRKGTQQAVAETGMAVIAIGHQRTEAWGLRALGALLREQWHELEVLVNE